MESLRPFAFLLGRILISLVFLMSGINKIMDYNGTAAYMEQNGMFLVNLFLPGAIVFLLAGSLSIILGFRARIGALLLIVFLIPATLIFHAFWAYPAEEQGMQMIQFMKNLGLLGGLLFMFYIGSGPLSLDRS